MPTLSCLSRLVPAALVVAALGCSRGDADRGRDGAGAPPSGSASAPAAGAPASAAASPSASGAASAAVGPASAAAGAAAAPGAGAQPPPAGDPMAIHYEAREDLVRLFSLKPLTERERRFKNPELFLEKNFGSGTPARINQGNKALARHTRSQEQCLAGLRGVVIQTEEQRARCGGHENMVPVFKTTRGKPQSAEFCIDVFEFPNKPCELPMVWASPTQAASVCSLQGKRLCTEDEWSLACRGDPEGGEPRTYAYGDELDLAVCHTQTRHRQIDGTSCDGDTARSAYQTCATDTEPAGSYPACRSRFGVFDQHGNVAEIMTRRDRDDGKLYSQLKGSAWFYVEVAREHDAPRPKGRETYPDHCAFSPRWHVEPMENAWHTNYHLGFRCCKTVR
ncbi:SUMF1/EgtB/PvdO family nonheme iron enzyme [Sorangium cellulosum]|uniref:SUMF1/EgtB/PvdO family nonheme iron enzyme n=1 Tax=Sorangium cellulosum TaxID=56 RepID=UPI0013312E0E|nr:SUMF1/EgtB/PvdO family nonheme iron enzyme [Sorangium cellulosum]